jgi:DNA-binding IclR family transcriptional regulator
MARNIAVRRVTKILKSFSDATHELGVTELSQKLDMAKSVIHGDLSILVQERLLEKNDQTGKYYLGSEVFRLGNAVYKQVNLRNSAYPVMERLSKITEETVILGAWVDSRPYCIERIKSSQPLNLSVDIGTWYPLHAGTIGKTLLAFLPEEEKDIMIEQIEFNQYTKNTITDKMKLKSKLQEICNNGYEVSIGERLEDVISLGAPIRNSNSKVIAVLCIGGPQNRFNEKELSNNVKLVIEAAKEISVKLGYRD